MTRSFVGAVRLLVDGRYGQSQTLSPRAEALLAPLDPAAWRRWAVERREDLIGRHAGDRCQLPDGGFGRVTEVFEGGGWTLACVPTSR